MNTFRCALWARKNRTGEHTNWFESFWIHANFAYMLQIHLLRAEVFPFVSVYTAYAVLSMRRSMCLIRWELKQSYYIFRITATASWHDMLKGDTNGKWKDYPLRMLRSLRWWLKYAEGFQISHFKSYLAINLIAIVSSTDFFLTYSVRTPNAR